mmetsp:Transcript_82321/g.129634  ORF Transcript_82321/g.129634 Transcript_82321/m.129634 type:complete len:105 (+) Transcript_82321:103-417(+)
MGCASSSATQPLEPVAKSRDPMNLVAGDIAIIRNCPNSRLNGERVICESYNADLNEWLVKGDRFLSSIALSLGMSIGEKFLEKELDRGEKQASNVIGSSVKYER